MPDNRFGIPKSNSTTSSPLPTYPNASSNVLPCSNVISSANSFFLDSIISFNLNIFLDLISGVSDDQDMYAFFAEFTASCTHFSVPKTTCEASSPVAGLKTDDVLLTKLELSLPLIRCSFFSFYSIFFNFILYIYI